jgi:hypothetical protein
MVKAVLSRAAFAFPKRHGPAAARGVLIGQAADRLRIARPSRRKWFWLSLCQYSHSHGWKGVTLAGIPVRFVVMAW